MKKILILLFLFFIINTAYSQITLSCDYTNSKNQRNEIHNFWSVRNRPADAKAMFVDNSREGSNLNCVRMLGGWPVKNLSKEEVAKHDPYQWDGTKFIYDWKVLKERIDKVRSSNMELYQFVIDNVPWAFTRGYKFVEEQDNVHHTVRDQEVRYGNGLPPYDMEAWKKFIVAMMEELVATYGDTVVEKWRFRIVTEADNNPNHWAGTKQEFYDFYKLTYDAIKSVLPSAIIGTQFLNPTHKFPPNWVDYKGNKIETFGSDFITWCKQNNVKYDFIGTSFYPEYIIPDDINMDTVYHQVIAPFLDNPDWNPNAELLIQEFNLRSQSGPPWIHNHYSHAASHFALMAKFVYERNVKEVYIWQIGTPPLFATEVLTMQALKTMLGKFRYSYLKSGSPVQKGNMIDGIFAKSKNNDQFDVLLYNYNVSPEYIKNEEVKLSLSVPFPVGTKLQYRLAYYGKEQCAFNRFAMDYPKAAIKESKGGWVLEIKDIAGNTPDILNNEGLAVFNEKVSDYTDYNTLKWTDWEEGSTIPISKELNSKIDLQLSLPSFAFKKYEFRVTQ